jgi:hypothetical protein
MKICVLCRGRDDPYAFHLGQRRHVVVAVLGRWNEALQEYFKVRIHDGRLFLLCHDTATGAWELAAVLPRPHQRSGGRWGLLNRAKTKDRSATRFGRAKDRRAKDRRGSERRAAARRQIPRG